MQYLVDKFKRAKYLYNIGGAHKLISTAYDGIMRRASSIYFKKIAYKDQYASDLIFIVGFPKSGSTWIANILATIPGFKKYTPSKWGNEIKSNWEPVNNLYPGIFEEFDKYLAVVKGHTYPTKDNLRIINEAKIPYLITVRDPRDQIISAYWYIRNRPYHRDYNKVEEMTLKEYISYKLNSGEHEQEEINWLRGWVKNLDDNAMIIRYEDMLVDTKVEIKKVLSHLKFNLKTSKVNEIIEKNSFKNVSGRERGEEEKNQFVRKGISGEWEDIFTDQQKEMYAQIGEDVISVLGYKPTKTQFS